MVFGSVGIEVENISGSSEIKTTVHNPRSKMKCNTTIVLDVKTSETSGVAYEKISSIAI